MTKNSQQITKDQHYVPQFYLKKFINNEGKLEILDCELRKIVTPRTPKNVCNEEYFYGLNGELDEASQILEKEFHRIETAISLEYDNVVKKILNQEEITESDKMLIATFMSLQYLRGPHMRKQVKKMDEHALKGLIGFKFSNKNIEDVKEDFKKTTGHDISEENAKHLIEMVDNKDYRIETNNASHLNLLSGMEGFRNLFFGKYWTIYVSKSSKKFITSDNPVVETFPDWAGKFFYGPDFLQRTHYFAMTPNIMIVATNPVNFVGKKIKRKTLFDNDIHNNKILSLNFVHPRYSIKYSYSSIKESLVDIIDNANLNNKQNQTRYILKTIIKLIK